MNYRQLLSFRPLAALLVAGGLAAVGLDAAPPLSSLASHMEGVGNFQKVDDHVYRGAQPTHEGFLNLSKLGIQTVIDLREPGDRSVTERKWVTDAGMHYVSVPMYGMATPSNESVVKVLELLEDRSTGPVFVHCKRGADRTGGVIACYRVEHYHWKNDQALSEARSMGMSWFQTAIQSYVRKYQPRDLTATATALAPVQP
jgi:tyrosine-protein phosphatase SIW14